MEYTRAETYKSLKISIVLITFGYRQMILPKLPKPAIQLCPQSYYELLFNINTVTY